MRISSKIALYVSVFLVATLLVVVGKGCYKLLAIDEPLDTAAARGDLSAVRKYVKAGGDIEYSIDDMGFTPLVQALYNGHDDVAEYLILQGANVKITCPSGETPFKLAKKGSKVYKMILERGGDRPEPSNWPAVDLKK